MRECGKKGGKARNWEEKACFLRKKHKKGQKNLVVSQKSITFAAKNENGRDIMNEGLMPYNSLNESVVSTEVMMMLSSWKCNWRMKLCG